MEYELMRIREFIDENWSQFQSFCERNGDDAEDIEEAISDE